MNASKKEKALVVALTLSIAAFVVALGSLAYGYTTIKTFRSETLFNTKVSKGIEAYIADQQAKQNQPPEAAKEVTEVSVDNDPMMGDKDAPVTVIEFSDYQCPFCGKFYSNVMPSLIEKYVKTGKVRFVYRDFPLSFHPLAQPAANATECAREQGGDEMYFKFHDQVFTNQPSLSLENLKKWGKDLGLDTAKFNACIDENRYAKEIEKDAADGQAAGVSGTPATFVNGRLVSGAVPFSVFEKAIEEELAK
jgi:protein-disulfide isomerase